MLQKSNYFSWSSFGGKEDSTTTTTWWRQRPTERQTERQRQRQRPKSSRETSISKLTWKLLVFLMVSIICLMTKRFRVIRFVEARNHHHSSFLAFQTPPSRQRRHSHPRHHHDPRHTRHTLQRLLEQNLYSPPPPQCSHFVAFHHNIPTTTKCFSTTSSESSSPSPMEDASSKVLLEGLNQAQIEAVTKPLSSITRVIAGPGAGKTRVLTCRIAHLLHKDPDKRVLAVTFTKKAAGEMHERLTKLVHQQEQQVLLQQHHHQQQQQQQQQQQEATTATATATADADTILQTAVASNRDVYEDEDGTIIQEEEADPGSSSSGGGTTTKGGRYMDRVTLGTFHSICAKVLRWNGKALATLPSIQKAMVSSSSPTTNATTTTTTLDGTFAIIDQSDQLRILKECLNDMGVDLKEQGLKPLTVLNAIGQIKSTDVMGQEETEKSGRKMGRLTKKIATELYPLYRHKLLSNNAVDFDDLIFMTRELLLHNPDIQERLQQRWNHVLVDEFQDTSRAQLDLVKLLSSSSLLIVGDADQSIYSWRGAHVESMSDFEHEFQHYDSCGGVQTVYLMENYRSTTNIVKAAQKIISDSTSSSSSSSNPQDGLRKDMKPMRGSGPTPRILACADGRAEASFVVRSILERMDTGEWNEGASVAIIYRTNAQSRALEEACVQLNLPYVIRGSAGTFYNRQEIKDCLCFLRWLYNGRDESAMVRAVKTPSRGIGEKALGEFGRYCAEVDNVYASQYPDVERPTPLDILISMTDRSVIPEKDIPSPSEFMTKRALNRFVPFSDQMRHIREKAYIQPVSVLLATIIGNLDLKSHFDSISKTDAEFQDRWSNVMELRKAADRYSQDGPCLIRHEAYAADEQGGSLGLSESPLSNFLDDVALVADTQSEDTDQGPGRLVANLMTIHASKGMEFDAVFLVGNEDGTFPTNQAITEGEGSVPLEEEKRLCYVAMTRAKTHLFMTWRREVQIFAGQGFQKIDAERSRFLDVLVSKKKNSGKIDERKKNTSKDQPRLKRTNDRSTSSRQERSTRMIASHEERGRTSWDSRRKKPPTATTNRPDPRIPGKRMKQKHAPTFPRQPRRAPTKGRSNRGGEAAEAGSNTRQLSTMPVRGGKPRMTGNNNKGSRSPKRTPKSRSTTGNRADLGGQTRQLSTLPVRKEKSQLTVNKAHMDSTWFYPVGSKVVHKRYGEGLVLPPPPPDDKDIMLVRVKFSGGEKLDFPADGPDLQPNF